MVHQISKINKAFLTRKQCKSGRQMKNDQGFRKNKYRFLFELVLAKYLNPGLGFLICDTILCAPQLLKHLLYRDVFLHTPVQNCDFTNQGIAVILI